MSKFTFIEDKKIEVESWTDIKKEMNTGDLILCHGKGFFSSIIQTATRSIYSHIMFVIKSKTLSLEYPTYKDPDHIYFLHSSKDILGIDVIYEVYKTGVQLVRSDEAVCRYISDGGKLFIRKSPEIYKDVIIHIDPLKNRQFKIWLLENIPKPYEKNIKELVSSSLDCFYMPCFENTKEDDSSYFCSELVAKIIQMLYGFNPKVQCNEKTPSDFSFFYMRYSYEIQFNELEQWKQEIEIIVEDLSLLCKKYLK